jgi:protein regulator of cytokinesis 1
MKKSQNEAECEGLRTQIRELWDRLQIPEEEREPVEAIMTGSKTKIRNAVRKPVHDG